MFGWMADMTFTEDALRTRAGERGSPRSER
jgi:hypothetical protein